MQRVAKPDQFFFSLYLALIQNVQRVRRREKKSPFWGRYETDIRSSFLYPFGRASEGPSVPRSLPLPVALPPFNREKKEKVAVVVVVRGVRWGGVGGWGGGGGWVCVCGWVLTLHSHMGNTVHIILSVLNNNWTRLKEDDAQFLHLVVLSLVLKLKPFTFA